MSPRGKLEEEGNVEEGEAEGAETGEEEVARELKVAEDEEVEGGIGKEAEKEGDALGLGGETDKGASEEEGTKRGGRALVLKEDADEEAERGALEGTDDSWLFAGEGS